MPELRVELRSPVRSSFRVKKAAGMFGLDVPSESVTVVRGTVPAVGTMGKSGEPWKVGAIIGASGSGKTTVARAAYGDAFVEGGFDWPSDRSILDGFPKVVGGERVSVDRIAGMLTAVGFSSPPEWMRPFRALSPGQRDRATLARVLMMSGGEGELAEGVVASDEFGGLVTSDVQAVMAASVAKAVRAGRTVAERYVAVGARGSEFVERLEPDWVLDMSEEGGLLSRGWVRPPEVASGRGKRRGQWEAWARWFGGERVRLRVEVVRDDRWLKRLWPRLRRFHYLDHGLHPSCRGYVAVWDGEGLGRGSRGATVVGIAATIHNAGKSGMRRVSRLVVPPDYQGVGIGMKLLDATAAAEAAEGHRVTIRSGHPAVIRALSRRRGWAFRSMSRMGSQHAGSTLKRTGGQLAGSWGRSSCGFEWVGVD